jgi:hypothetical protein
MWSHHLLVRIGFLDLAPVINNRYREETRPVEVDIDIQEVPVELVNWYDELDIW